MNEFCDRFEENGPLNRGATGDVEERGEGTERRGVRGLRSRRSRGCLQSYNEDLCLVRALKVSSGLQKKKKKKNRMPCGLALFIPFCSPPLQTNWWRTFRKEEQARNRHRHKKESNTKTG